MGVIGDGLELMKLANVATNADLYEKLGKYVEKAQILQAQVELLQEENKALQEQIRIRGSLVRLRGLTYLDGDDDPICGRCAEVRSLIVHLHKPPLKSVCCPECNMLYGHAPKRSQLEQQVSS
jgi:hypothetical protein